MVVQGTNKTARTPWGALAALLCVSLIWGVTFVWMKDGMEAAEASLGPGSVVSALALFLVLRFGLAAGIVYLISPAARRNLGRAEWRSGAWLGGLLFAGFALQMLGLVQVTPAVSAFLTSLYVLFTAGLSALRANGRLRKSLVVGAVFATIGAGLVRGRPDLGFTSGEWLTILGALFFAIHILVTDRATKRHDPMAVTLTSFVVVFGAGVALFCLARTVGTGPSFANIADLLTTRAFLVPLALTTVLATVIALSLMNLFQRRVDPVRAAIVYAFEPIFATVFGLMTGHDELTAWLWFGGSALLLGNLVAELGARREELSHSAS
ncbi:MAG: EamA family transporter [Planctomycetes bacterium]|nr:EamA family transporter [Planctomycetota bacterium]